MSHIFTEDGKQWYLIPELPQLMEVQGQAGHIIIAENQRRMDEAKDNALPIVNPEVIETVYPKPYPGLYKWPGTWEDIYSGNNVSSPFEHKAKLIAPQQPQAETNERFKKPTGEQVVEFVLLFNEGVIDKGKLVDMVGFCQMVIDRLYDNGDILKPSKQEMEDRQL